MKHKGILTKWNDDRGFGFITPKEGKEPVFVHISAFARGQGRPVLNASLTYRLVRDDQQRPRAEAVRLAGQWHAPGKRRGRALMPAVLVSGVFFGGLAALVPPPEWQRLAGFYALARVVAFLFYGLDKRAATRGGWPGALLAQRVFRHKTRKAEFQVVFYLAVAANLGALGWLLCADAGEDLRSTVGLTQVTLGWLQGFAS